MENFLYGIYKGQWPKVLAPLGNGIHMGKEKDPRPQRYGIHMGKEKDLRPQRYGIHMDKEKKTWHTYDMAFNMSKENDEGPLDIGFILVKYYS